MKNLRSFTCRLLADLPYQASTACFGHFPRVWTARERDRHRQFCYSGDGTWSRSLTLLGKLPDWNLSVSCIASHWLHISQHFEDITECIYDKLSYGVALLGVVIGLLPFSKFFEFLVIGPYLLHVCFSSPKLSQTDASGYPLRITWHQRSAVVKTGWNLRIYNRPCSWREHTSCTRKSDTVEGETYDPLGLVYHTCA